MFNDDLKKWFFLQLLCCKLVVKPIQIKIVSIKGRLRPSLNQLKQYILYRAIQVTLKEVLCQLCTFSSYQLFMRWHQCQSIFFFISKSAIHKCLGIVLYHVINESGAIYGRSRNNHSVSYQRSFCHFTFNIVKLMSVRVVAVLTDILEHTIIIV